MRITALPPFLEKLPDLLRPSDDGGDGYGDGYGDGDDDGDERGDGEDEGDIDFEMEGSEAEEDTRVWTHVHTMCKKTN
jgi:hypothetical protein